MKPLPSNLVNFFDGTAAPRKGDDLEAAGQPWSVCPADYYANLCYDRTHHCIDEIRRLRDQFLKDRPPHAGK